MPSATKVFINKCLCFNTIHVWPKYKKIFLKERSHCTGLHRYESVKHDDDDDDDYDDDDDDDDDDV